MWTWMLWSNCYGVNSLLRCPVDQSAVYYEVLGVVDVRPVHIIFDGQWLLWSDKTCGQVQDWWILSTIFLLINLEFIGIEFRVNIKARWFEWILYFLKMDFNFILIHLSIISFIWGEMLWIKLLQVFFDQ